MDSSSETQLLEVFELLQTIDQIWNSIEEKITDKKNTIIVILLGSQDSGKTKFFNYLKKDNLAESKTISSSNNSQQFDAFNVEQPKPHLFLDFHSTLNSENNNMNLLFEELFLRLIQKYKIKIIYILEHPEYQLLNRGYQLQEFISKYLDGNHTSIQGLILILNKYKENLDHDQLMKKVKQQIQEIYSTCCEKIFVFRKTTTQEMDQNEFSFEKKCYIQNTIYKQDPIQLNINQFRINCKSVQLIDQISKNTLASILKSIQEKNNEANRLNQKELQELKQQYQEISYDAQAHNSNILFFKSTVWTKLIEDTIQHKNNEFNNYLQLMLTLPKYTNIISKSKISEEVDKMVQDNFQVLIQNVETYINLQSQYNYPNMANKKYDMNIQQIEQNITKYKSLYKIQFEELSLKVNKDYEKQPCESTKKLKINIDTLEEYQQQLEELEELKKEKKKYEDKIKVEKYSCYQF